MIIDKLVQEVGISHEFIHTILYEDLKMKWECKVCPAAANPDQMECRKAWRIQFSSDGPLLVTSRECLLPTREKDVVIRMAHNVLCPTKEITARQIQYKSGAHCVL